MSPLRLSGLSRWLRLVPAVLLVVVLMREAPWKHDWPRISPWALAAMLAINFGVFLVMRTWRWRVALGTPQRFGALYASLLEGLLASIALGFGSGDVVRAARLPGKFTTSYGATIAERGAEFVAMALLLLAGFAFANLGWFALAAAATLLVAYFVVLTCGHWILPRLARWPRLSSALTAGLAASTASRVTAMVGLSLAGWLAELGILRICLAAFGLPSSGATALLVLLGINVATALPGPPANVGTFEAGIVGGLALAGIPFDRALVFALGYHLIMTVPVAAAGAIVLVVRGRRAAA